MITSTGNIMVFDKRKTVLRWWEHIKSVIRWQNWKIYCFSALKIYSRMLLFENAKQWYFCCYFVASLFLQPAPHSILLTFAPLFFFSNNSIIRFSCVFFSHSLYVSFFFPFHSVLPFGENISFIYIYTKQSSTRKWSENGAQPYACISRDRPENTLVCVLIIFEFEICTLLRALDIVRTSSAPLVHRQWMDMAIQTCIKCGWSISSTRSLWVEIFARVSFPSSFCYIHTNAFLCVCVCMWKCVR